MMILLLLTQINLEIDGEIIGTVGTANIGLGDFSKTLIMTDFVPDTIFKNGFEENYND